MVYQNSAMHIMEGLHLYPVEIWFALSLPVVAYGVYKMNRMSKETRETLAPLGHGRSFVLSLLKLPFVT